MEQSDVSVVVRFSQPSPARGLSPEVRASLEAVRIAQVGARQRARRQTMKARIWFTIVMGALGFAAVAVAPRLARIRHPRPHASPSTGMATATTAMTPPAAQPVKAEMTATAPAKAEPTVSSPAPSDSPGATDHAPTAVAAPATAADVVAATAGCDTGLIRRAPWRLSASSCARAFDAAGGTNATLALAIAHAEHAHGSATAAADWARRALELDPTAAEAYVLIARADLKTGHDDDARTAYRRYLELAPRGWHQREAREAVHAGRSTTRSDSDPAAAR
jgi:hypothetical protein